MAGKPRFPKGNFELLLLEGGLGQAKRQMPISGGTERGDSGHRASPPRPTPNTGGILGYKTRHVVNTEMNDKT